MREPGYMGAPSGGSILTVAWNECMKGHSVSKKPAGAAIKVGKMVRCFFRVRVYRLAMQALETLGGMGGWQQIE